VVLYGSRDVEGMPSIRERQMTAEPLDNKDPALAEVIDVDTLIVGAGMSGLGFASFWKEAHARGSGGAAPVVVVDRANEPGGWCRTVKQDGFVWDYSGHFFHFRHKDLETRLTRHMPAGAVRTINKVARVVDVDGCEVAFPYQRSIAELPKEAFIACLRDLWLAEQSPLSSAAAMVELQRSFKQMLYDRLGQSLCERFLVPYNEKLYATDLDRLDADCMGRFFPVARFSDVMAGLAGVAAGADYNATFTYPRDGAAAYVAALVRDLSPGELLLGEAVTAIDVPTKTATTTTRRLRYRRLITSAPLPATLKQAALPHDEGAFSGNRVLVFNLGFAEKGRRDVHWLYFASKDLPFYRVGFYDNIFDDDRMSLYVEVGLNSEGVVEIDLWRERVLKGLKQAGIMTHQTLISWHAVLMDPAYAHITARSQSETSRTRALLEEHQVFSIGRYGGWTYCSIEDNLVEARALAERLVGG